MNKVLDDIETIKSEAERRVEDEMKRSRKESFNDHLDKMETKTFLIWIGQYRDMEFFLRKQEILKCSKLIDTDFFEPIKKHFNEIKSVKKTLKQIKKPKIKSAKQLLQEQVLRRRCNRFWIGVPIVWFIASIILGALLSTLNTPPPDFLLSLYSSYAPYINKYELFCLSMLGAFFLLPTVWFVLWENTPAEIKSTEEKHSVLSTIMLLLLTIFVVIAFASFLVIVLGMGFGGLLGVSGARGDIRTALVGLFDWVGGIMVNIICISTALYPMLSNIKDFVVGFKKSRRNKDV